MAARGGVIISIKVELELGHSKRLYYLDKLDFGLAESPTVMVGEKTTITTTTSGRK